MIKIQNIIDCLQAVAPLNFQESYDNSGLVIGNSDLPCTGIEICLDIFPDIVQKAINDKCNLIISHHPLIFKGIKKIKANSEFEQILSLALTKKIAIYCAHTSMDNATIGVTNALAEQLELKDLKPLENKAIDDERYFGAGLYGVLDKEIKAEDFLLKCKQKLSLPMIKFAGNKEKTIKTIGLCGGSGSFVIQNAIDKGCDLFATADIKYHDFLDFGKDIILCDIGHMESEQFIKQRISDIILKNFCNFAPVYVVEQTNRIQII